MQEINELKNLVIQSLEGNGVLGQIRAQIRASVFKIIEMQETNTKKNAGFFWENPTCQTIYDHSEGKLALEIINDFLEFFKMDYTSSVFSHESNLKEGAKREELLRNLGIKGDNSKPVLFQILGALSNQSSLNKENQSSSNISVSTKVASTLSTQPKTDNKAKNIATDFQEADLSKKTFDNFGKKKPDFTSFEEPQADLSRKGGLGKLPALSSVSPQDKFGSGQAKDDFLGQKKQEEIKKIPDFKKEEPVAKLKPKQEEEFEEEYANEEFEEELIEDYEEEEEDDKDRHAYNSSEDIIGASQSQGFDVSVDSLALEEYDYFENADRVR